MINNNTRLGYMFLNILASRVNMMSCIQKVKSITVNES